MKKFFISISICCTLMASCLEHEYKQSIKIKNNSLQKISTFDSRYYDLVDKGDIALPAEKPTLNNVKPNEYVYHDPTLRWDVLLSKHYPNRTFRIFIVSTDTIEKYSWDQIRADYNIIKRYDLNLQDLENMNWEIRNP